LENVTPMGCKDTHLTRIGLHCGGTASKSQTVIFLEILSKAFTMRAVR